jgi:hypothetical protein
MIQSGMEYVFVVAATAATHLSTGRVDMIANSEINDGAQGLWHTGHFGSTTR